jgi:hypothetical protein
VDVVHLDLWQGTSYSIVRHELSGLAETDTPFYTQICGDFAIARLGNRYRDKLYLLKLSTKSCRSFAMNVRSL